MLPLSVICNGVFFVINSEFVVVRSPSIKYYHCMCYYYVFVVTDLFYICMSCPSFNRGQTIAN